MSIETKYPNIIGQKPVLNKLNFFVELQNSTGEFPFVLLTGSRGSGKNLCSSEVAKNLLSTKTKQTKKIIEVNSATIESIDDFFDSIVIPHLVDQETTIILDEFHAIANVKGLIDIFLSIFNTNNKVNKVTRSNQDFYFSKAKLSWLLLTSEPHLLPETLLSRCESIQLELLSTHELSKVIQKNLKEIKANDDLLDDIASTTRQNGRESFKLADNIYQHLKKQNKTELKWEDWADIRKQLGIRKYGINNTEYKIMQYLRAHPKGASLSKLSSALQLTANCARLGNEQFLLANDFISIENGKGRILAKRGHDYLSEIKD